jgi:hypothetical protein
LSLNPEIVGEKSNVADADKAVAVNTQIAAEASVAAETARVEQVKLETTGESSDKQPVAKGSTEGDVYGGAGMAAVTGGSATAELAQMGVQVVKEVLTDTNDLGGMEKPVTAPVQTAAKGNSIQTPFFNDVAGRSKGISDFMSGEDKVKGVKAEPKISALKSIQQVNHALKSQAELHAGNAINHKAGLGAQAHQTQQMGMAPGGVQQLALNSVKPNGPTHMTDEETGALG